MSGDGSDSASEAALAELREQLARKERELDAGLERLRVAQEMLLLTRKAATIGQLAGGLAHGFNNLLTVVIGVQDVLALELPEDSPLHKDLGAAQDAALQAADVARKLHVLAQRRPPEIRPIDVRDLVGGSLDILRRSLSEKVAIRAALADGLPALRGDAAQLETALLDLGINARDAMPDGGELVVEVDRVELDEAHAAAHPGAATGTHVRITVRDTGCGMDEPTRSRIFEPFFTTKPPGTAAGLGLTMVHAAVRAHHGHIAVTSEPKRGTTFSLYLPASLSAPMPAGGPAIAAGSTNVDDIERGRGETLLVVDDDAAVLRTASRALSTLGYHVLTADSGKAALERIEKAAEPIGLVLIDIVMPVMGGLATLRHLRELRPGMPALLMTGYAGRDFVPPVDLGAEVISKPLDLAKLAAAIRTALERNR
jgi:signal transduction histidine kinase/ActR/RegA family two-component response regulator